MTRSMLAAGPAFLGSALVLFAWPQVSPQTAQEVLAASVADLRGQKELIETSTTRNVVSFSATGTPMISTVTSPVRESAGTVSAGWLRHRPPKAAQEAHKKGGKLIKKKKLESAAQEFERAIALDPGFADAHNDLGVVYARLGRYPEATAEFRRAIELLPQESSPRSNLAWALFLTGVRTEAEESARRAIQLSPDNAPAHMLIGRLLTENPATLSEGLSFLEYAGRTMPEAKQLVKTLRKK